MKTTADTKDDLLMHCRASRLLLRAVDEVKPQCVPTGTQTAVTEHLPAPRVEELNSEFVLDPYSRQDLIESVCTDGYIDAHLARDGDVALSLKINARDRFA